LRAACAGIEGLRGREIEVGSSLDPGWGYYRDFLYPDAERLQWIKDKMVVTELRNRGDRLVARRRVDHWVYFRTGEARDAFVASAEQAGFASESRGAKLDGGAGDRRFEAQVHRVDAVALEEIHAVVMQLARLAEEHGGDYDGWETSVERE